MEPQDYIETLRIFNSLSLMDVERFVNAAFAKSGVKEHLMRKLSEYNEKHGAYFGMFMFATALDIPHANMLNEYIDNSY